MADSNSWGIQVNRGPGWLYVHLQPGRANPSDIAERIWAAADRHFTYRIVLEMDDVDAVSRQLAEQLAALEERVMDRHGTLRYCGLTPSCFNVLRDCQLERPMSKFDTRTDAVRGHQRQRVDAEHVVGATDAVAASLLV